MKLTLAILLALLLGVLPLYLHGEAPRDTSTTSSLSGGVDDPAGPWA
jgi:hypothetical protein